MSEVKKRFFDLTIAEAKEIGFTMGDLFVFEVQGYKTSFNFSWDHVIRIVNYLEGKEVLSEKSTIFQAFTSMKSFL